MSQYTTSFSKVDGPERSEAPIAPIKNNPNPIIGDHQQQFVTSQPADSSNRVIGREERIEYRDEAGNIVDPEEVSRLQKEGKISLQTKYQTQTRVIDEYGNEIIKNADQQHAPPHPDVEGQNPETNRNGEDSVARNEPASVAGSEKSIYSEREANVPKPASENKAATK